MPNMTFIHSAVAELSKGPPLVVVLDGGTTGIGSYVANSLAKSFASNGSKLRVYIVRRLATSRYAAKGTIEDPDKKIVGGVEVAKSTLGELGGGSYALGQRGDIGAKGKSYEEVRQEGTSKQVWDHTMEILTRIEKENAKPP
jgi:hypothetical protein